MGDNFEITFSVALLIGFAVVASIASNYSCKARWDGSGMAVTWGPMQGCKVRLPDGRWLPEDRVREIDIKEKS